MSYHYGGVGVATNGYYCEHCEDWAEVDVYRESTLIDDERTYRGIRPGQVWGVPCPWCGKKLHGAGSGVPDRGQGLERLKRLEERYAKEGR